MLFHELNCGKCKTYLIACESTRKTALVDPVKEKVDRYLAALAYYGCSLRPQPRARSPRELLHRS